MRRAHAAIIVFACLALVPAAAAWAGKPRGLRAASVKVHACKSASDPDGRRVTFASRMRSTNGKDQLQMRFALHQRLPGETRWRNITDAEIGKPHRADGVRLFRQQLTVTELLAPARYRTVVRYRWERDGKVIGRARRTSPSCNQRVARPDLSARDLVITPLPADGTGLAKARYDLTVRNRGKGNADGFEVDFLLGTQNLAAATVPKLGPGASITLSRTARACPSGRQITAQVDPDDLIPELREDNNSATAVCP